MRFVSDFVNAIPKGRTFINQIQTKWIHYICFVLWCVSGSKAPYLVSGMKEHNFIPLVLCQNKASDIANRKPCVSMPLSPDGFTMLARITFLVFPLSINVL